MAKGHWLVKSEPETYSWQRFVTEKRAVWDGIRNFEARNNLRAMKKGDVVLYYHTGDEKAVVGLATVAGEARPEETEEGDWSVVDLVPKKALKKPVPLSVIKSDPALAAFTLVKKPRLSVVPVTAPELERVLALGETKL